ncbi:hypothetical protein [Nostoc sp. DedQUE07]|uniref:hypothetical protein n=1 Tax=Nostoc sp. DedQUE07 TaxID=3075392 RepID=UPI002AD4D944|nr:hypothetical protein [Nostoc sp. DedQUE07]MDZ8131982.1 hypothetical protein [Nostoc sp. DedQUE07]
MALIDFYVPYAVGWVGKTYQPGLQAIPEELAVALGWSPPPTEDDAEAQKASEAQRSAKQKRTPAK